MHTKMLAIAAIALPVLFSPAVQAHTRLESSSPQANAVVAAAPKEIRLQFSEPLELPFSKVKLVGPKGAAIAPSKIAIDKANQKVLVASMPALGSGQYRVQWSTVTRDGHKVKGEFNFSIK